MVLLFLEALVLLGYSIVGLFQPACAYWVRTFATIDLFLSSAL